MTRVVLSVVMLTVVYALTLSSLDPWDLAIGALLSATLLVLFRPVTIGHHAAQLPGLPLRVVYFWPFLARVGMDVVTGAWSVALVILGVRPLQRAQVVA